VTFRASDGGGPRHASTPVFISLDRRHIHTLSQSGALKKIGIDKVKAAAVIRAYFGLLQNDLLTTRRARIPGMGVARLWLFRPRLRPTGSLIGVRKASVGMTSSPTHRITLSPSPLMRSYLVAHVHSLAGNSKSSGDQPSSSGDQSESSGDQ